MALLSLAVVVAGCSGADGEPRRLARGAAPSTSTSTTSTTTTTSAPRPPAPTTRRVTPNVPAPAPGLQGVVDAAVANRPVPVSVVAVDLTTGERGQHLSDRVVLSASLYKLFVARELFRRIGEGSLARSDASGDGGHTVEQCLRLMIVVSDDRCGEAGLRMVGGGALDPSLHRDGFTATFLASPQRTSAANVAEFLRRERTADSELYALLRQQQVNDRIPPALPPGTPIAHKTGDRTHWAHDAGIVTTPKGEVVVVVLTGPWPAPCCHEERIGALERRAFALIGDVGRRVYDWVARPV